MEPVTISLFEEPESEKTALAKRLQKVALRGTYFGTSSWKYEGWLGQVYRRQRYLHRGRFSKKRFEQECLAEYAEVFSTVCGDFAFYQFPTAAFWENLFTHASQQLRFSFKVPEEITAPVFADHPRYGARGGRTNQTFLDPKLFEDLFAGPLQPFSDRTDVLIFEFGAVCGELFSPAAFTERIGTFLESLSTPFRYSIEVRSPEFLEDPRYAEMLRLHRVAHVFNAWSGMPPLSQQIQIPNIFTTDFTVVRALLTRGCKYADAVRRFSPYSSIQERDPDARSAIRDIVVRTERRGETAYIYVNNRLEGNAPGTIQEILEDLSDDEDAAQPAPAPTQS